MVHPLRSFPVSKTRIAGRGRHLLLITLLFPPVFCNGLEKLKPEYVYIHVITCKDHSYLDGPPLHTGHDGTGHGNGGEWSPVVHTPLPPT